jgi:drug/metabolite transporter (DMT)-like permease
MAIMAAITETIIYTFVRSNKLAAASPFYTMNHIYPAGLVALILYSLTSTKETLSTSKIGWTKLIAFNAILGFTGYLARFYSIPKLHVIIFSLLSFIGVLSAYTWGAIFTNELPTKQGVLGGLLIASSIGFLRYFNA